MKFLRLLLVFPFILTLVGAAVPEPGSAGHVAAVSHAQAHSQHPHVKIPALEELTVVRQKDAFVARKYRNYDTNTVTPTLSKDEL